ncbi:anthranilate synthase component I [Ponticoccus sp. SC2-23]|uniref:anthranilate synthase component I n=1 Tax=Alexandriicola marinus TaxID=2081710 RepID=UPI000FDB096B|nr:anthranilate synthase component I [Alexandriicola marinus]MBM1219233.1 anthranilate synthase component I [Ponticoccus sp. SC6-9]MBM1223695.1 anthranilate synthase component I [Ponticoccus sp. SC6-15]MBM1229046.1 anthranilate synthase component I [Ponticoccus sp. SC6-38]MBM1232661.1 anthranilate synthase component I [Ponticoccus sp. SC6-45]MBM1237389.1 anthranilate synthase component I [Ponticoccus sp. SC6-49]MBM1241672.1 anthranilate synthase component I [Ponticoccus sp. SC2-64]MBM1246185
MALLPEYDAFRDGYEAGRNQIVWTRLAADLDTPVSLMLRLAGAGKHAFMLESVTGGEVRGRYSIIGFNPDLIWECRGTSARINREARYDEAAFVEEAADPLTSLRALLDESRIDLPADLPAASAGLFGYLGYDMIRLVEHLPDINPDPLGLPDAIMLRPSVVAVLDGVKGDVILVAPAWANSGLTAKAAFAQAAERVMDAQRALDRPVPTDSRALSEPRPPGPPVSNFTKGAYMAAVDKAKEYIRAGDIFQVVPSQRWSVDFHEPPFALYRSLRRTNPSPFMFYFNFGGFQVVGASPEILVRVFDREVTIRPIAGTRPRGATPDEDRANEASLMADEKELAEHLMLLDLGRNDVGRVAKIGTVRPTEEFVVERYSHVMHIVSNVVGELAPEHDALSAFFAGMPAGTVSGAPKVRAMEIIDELEPEKRGVYGGGLGYFSARGDMDMCIALRTAILKDRKLYIQAGGGVVHDSDPEAEYMETVHKSNALRSAAEDATRFRRDGN